MTTLKNMKRLIVSLLIVLVILQESSTMSFVGSILRKYNKNYEHPRLHYLFSNILLWISKLPCLFFSILLITVVNSIAISKKDAKKTSCMNPTPNGEVLKEIISCPFWCLENLQKVWIWKIIRTKSTWLGQQRIW